jgi:hypothetical protein
MRRTIERFFEAVESNVGCAVFAVVVSLAMTACLHLLCA